MLISLQYEGKCELMKVYLVGGAVRDQLLGLPYHEKDWVVVGSTPEQLINQNFRQVGRDFPVFLHPVTNEEYALARTERKSGSGYYGFKCDFSPSVTLEEDLGRRDLTINAMAMDHNGQIIDPFHGQLDLQKRVLRHVSPAFVEDPVRVLRVARFAARYYSLGFRIAEETRFLMYKMVKNGELHHLVPERVWQEWERSLKEINPEQFILTLRSCDALKVIFPEINSLFGIPNPSNYHHEIDSGIHTLLVLKAVVKLTDDPVVRFAALVHDLGKTVSPIQYWPQHIAHDNAGIAIIDQLCDRLKIPNEFRQLAVVVSKYHLKVHLLSELRANTIVNTLEAVDAFRRPHLFNNLLLASQADAEGCGKNVNYLQAKGWRYILSECVKISPQNLIAQGYKGRAIKDALHQKRVACVESILQSGIFNEE